jgi:hypothetical protein
MTDYKPTYETSYALVIGINSYRDPALAPLGNAEEDASQLADLLESERYKFKVKRLLGEKATKRAIQQNLFQLRQTEPDARVLVYFSGHGYTVTDNFGETGYLACYDTVAKEDFTALELREVTTLRRRTKAKHVAFIFDACFSGHALGLTKAATVTAEQFMLRRAFQVISAGAPDQTVSDYRSMTHHLLPLLRDATTMLTLEQIGVALKQRMTAESEGMQIPQHGQITGSEGGDFVFYLPPEPEALDTIDPQLADALSDANPRMRYFALAELERTLSDPNPHRRSYTEGVPTGYPFLIRQIAV